MRQKGAHDKNSAEGYQHAKEQVMRLFENG